MYRLYIDNKPTDIVTEVKRGAWDLIQADLWQEHYPNEEFPLRYRAKFIKEEEVDFDALPPKEKVKLLASRMREFQELELCIVCGEKTVRAKGNRFMVPLDGAWPMKYFNLWRHKECKE